MKSWLLKNGVNVALLCLALGIISGILKMNILSTVFIVLFLGLYGIVSIINYQYHKKSIRLIIQMVIVLGAIIFKIYNTYHSFSLLSSLTVLIFSIFILIDYLTLNKLVRK